MADIGTGITMTFGTSAFTCNIIDVDAPTATRGKVDSTHQGTTTARTKIPMDLVDWDDATITMEFDPSKDPPIGAVAETITITWPDGDGWVFTGFMTEYKGGAQLEDKMTGSFTLAVSGNVSISSNSSSSSSSTSS